MVVVLATCILLSIGLVFGILLLTWLRQLPTISTERRELINVEVNLDDFIAEFGEEYVDFIRSSSVDSGIYGCDQWE